jgi:hypothetical protein
VPRKRLRPLLEEVIADVDLQASVAQVADPPVSPGAPSAESSATTAPTAADAEAFPPPPWEVPPVVVPPRPANGGLTEATNGAPVAQAEVVALADVLSPAPLVVVAAEVPIAAAMELAPVESATGESDAAVADIAPSPLTAAASDTIEIGHAVFPSAAEAPEFAAAPLDAPGPEASATVPAAVVPAGAPPPLNASSTAAPAVAPVVLGTPDAAQMSRRRRRSASLLPPLPSPTDIPEDAAGRVAILSVLPPPDSTPVAPLSTSEASLAQDGAPSTAPSAPPSASITAIGSSTALAGWAPVLALGVALVLLFVVGVLVTH